MGEEGNVCLRSSRSLSPCREDVISQTAFFFYNENGVLAHKAYGGSDGVCRTKVPPGRYRCKVCCGDIPSDAATLEKYGSHMPSLMYNCYDSSHTGFSMYGETEFSTHGVSPVKGDVALTRNFCRVVVASVEAKDFRNASPGKLTELKVEKVVLADMPGRAHMEGDPDDSGELIINRVENGSIDFCTGSLKQCTVGTVGDELFCMSADEGRIVIQTLASFDIGEDKIWYYSIPISTRANHSYTYNVTVKGPGSDVPGGPVETLVSFSVREDDWGDGSDIEIDF